MCVWPMVHWRCELNGFIVSRLLSLLAAYVGVVYASPALAQVWEGTQGDVLQLEHAPGAIESLYCFGRSWPVRRLQDGRLRGWIGIDLKKRPGEYQVSWKGRDGSQDVLRVLPGHFRISRITVARKMAEFDSEALARIRRDQKAILRTYGMRVDAYPDVKMYGMPVEGVVSTPFGAQRYVNGQPRSPHSGLDIAASEGSPVQAPLAGKVLLRESMFLNGNTVVLGHGNGLVSVFSHLRDIAVKEGEWVRTGQRIGSVGHTGRATGPHLHWGVRFYQARVNPVSLLAESDVPRGE